MAVRILHCSDNLENYNICVNQKICGFANRGANPGDLVYLAVKINGVSLCGARFTLGSVTDECPWNDGATYVNILYAKTVEFCKPFKLDILKSIGGPYWGLKYAQGAKTILDSNAISALDSEFSKNASECEVEMPESIKKTTKTIKDDDSDSVENEKDAEIVQKEAPDVKINIMGTFQAIQFQNETDKLNGLEKLVTENFYSLFPAFVEDRTVLIPENRMFMTEGVYKQDGSVISGIRTIPDALLLKFDPNSKKGPFQINLIEYECYGNKSAKQKSDYLNTTIIPQLMRFAAGFSVITDAETRRKTTDRWIEKFAAYLQKPENKHLEDRMLAWMREINPNLSILAFYSDLEKKLRKAFETNIRVLLIIDELSREQKTTIKNIINAFKLEEECVEFDGYVVSLVQRINIKDASAQYALTVQL